MTTQSTETIIFNGKELDTYTLPLNEYPNLPKFCSITSLNRRGYCGTWEVRNNQLFLVKLFGHIAHPTKFETTYHSRYNFDTEEFEQFAKENPIPIEIDIKYLFPDTPSDGVLADWFTGDININQGEMIFRGYNNSYEKYLKLSFENGKLINEKIIGA